MKRKALAAIALAVLAVFAVPAAANAVDTYPPATSVTVEGTPAPGASVTVHFADGSFQGGEAIHFVVTGNDGVTQDGTGTADANGAVDFAVTLPADASGTYTVVATGQTSGIVGSVTLTVNSADGGGAGTVPGANAGGGLASTGYEAPVLLIGTAGGVMLLGIAMLVVLNVRRRRSVA